MAKAVVDAAREKYLDHEEMHSKVEYIVAHGISTTINGKKAIIGSYHFVFEDENSIIPEGMEEKFRHLPEEYSHLYLALEGVLAAVICIEDPLRPEAAEIIRQLKKAGLKKIVMMTGDSERTAKAIAKKVGVDEYYAEVLPEDKANFVEKEKAEKARKQQTKAPPDKEYHGKQSLKKLTQQNIQLSNIEITDNNIKAFEKVAKKYGIDFSLKRDKSVDPPRYFVFFKARDVEVMTAAFREFTGKTLNKTKKPSVRKKLQQAITARNQDKQREREKSKEKQKEPTL